MMMGSVVGRRILVNVGLRVPGRPVLEIEFVADTGFAGFLTLPPAAVAALGLPFFYDVPAHLADGSRVRTNVHLATIVWHDTDRQVEVLAMGNRPLLGASLMDGHNLSVDYTDGGTATFTPLSP